MLNCFCFKSTEENPPDKKTCSLDCVQPDLIKPFNKKESLENEEVKENPKREKPHREKVQRENPQRQKVQRETPPREKFPAWDNSVDIDELVNKLSPKERKKFKEQKEKQDRAIKSQVTQDMRRAKSSRNKKWRQEREKKKERNLKLVKEIKEKHATEKETGDIAVKGKKARSNKLFLKWKALQEEEWKEIQKIEKGENMTDSDSTGDVDSSGKGSGNGTDKNTDRKYNNASKTDLRQSADAIEARSGNSSTMTLNASRSNTTHGTISSASSIGTFFSPLSPSEDDANNSVATTMFGSLSPTPASSGEDLTRIGSFNIFNIEEEGARGVDVISDVMSDWGTDIDDVASLLALRSNDTASSRASSVTLSSRASSRS